jgi:hypothetical protein
MTKRRDPERDLDELLGEGGGEMGDLYRRLPRYEPPRRLDRAVLGEAARSVLSGKPPRRQRWIFGLGSAAGLVLAAGIAWRIGHDAMNQDTVPAPTSAPIVVPVEPISEPARAKHEEPAQPAAADNASAPPAPASSAEGALRSRSLQDEAKSRASEKAKPVSKRAPVAPPVATEAQKPAPPPAAAPQAFPDSAQEREQTQDSAAQAYDRAAPALGGAAAGADRKRAEQSAARPMPSTTPPSASVELRRDMQLAPEEWLSHIHQLLRQGRRQQAMESLRLFQRVHPDWRIPDDLQPLLR